MIADLSAAAARQRTQQPEPGDAPDDAPKIIDADVAFVVYRTPDGRTSISPDLNIPVHARRTGPTTHEVAGMCLNVLDDVRLMNTAPVTAEAVVNRLAQAQQAQMVAMQEMAVRQQMAQQQNAPH